MDIYIQLSDLTILHPKLLWDDIAAAPLAVLRAPDKTHPIALELQIENASCFWRAGQREQAQNLFNSLLKTRPDKAPSIQEALADLEREYP